MARFFLFRGYDYYPQGGAADFAGAFPTIADAIAADATIDAEDRKKGSGREWAHVFDSVELRIVTARIYELGTMRSEKLWREDA